MDYQKACRLAHEVFKTLKSGWWLISKISSSTNKKEEIGYVASDYLKPYRDQDVWKSMSSEDLEKYLGFACHENVGSGDTAAKQLKYVAIEDYHTEDPCQLCLKKDEMVLVIEMSEDGT